MRPAGVPEAERARDAEAGGVRSDLSGLHGVKFRVGPWRQRTILRAYISPLSRCIVNPFLLSLALSLGHSAGAMPIGEMQWRAVNDTVMGGVSQGTVNVREHVRFEGVLSLEQNGGFASIRAPTPPGALVDATALRVVVNGDGRTYELTLRRADVPLRAGSYRVAMPTEQGETELLLPLSDFRPTSFGRPVTGAPALDTALDQVNSIGIMLADKQPGPFALEVLEISAVRGPKGAGGDRASLRKVLSSAVEAGVPLFNNGDALGCRNTYAAALGQVLAQPGLTQGERRTIGAALDAAETQTAADGAWTLRYAIDGVLRVGR